MRSALVALLFTVLTLSASAGQNAQDIKIGQRFSLYSKTLNEERSFSIYLPASYDDSTYMRQRYPVMYLLDGDAHFHSASGVVQFMSTGINGNYQIPELIVVAIPNTNRMRDLTPTNSVIGYDGEESTFLKDSGGGDAFLKFIKDELFVHVDATYRTRPYRILVGHSLGGLLALHTLLDAPEMFQSYIAIDPSLWWDNQVLVHKVEDKLRGAQNLNGTLYLSSAKVRHDIGLGDPLLMGASIQRFAKVLQLISGSDLRFTIQEFETEDHGSVPLISLYHGLLFIFDGYKPSLKDFFAEPSILNAHFKKASERIGLNLLPPEAIVDRMGMAILHRFNKADQAVELFKLNVLNFPDSYHAYESLGDAYMTLGEKSLAIENYEKSLELNPSNQSAMKGVGELRRQEANK